MTSMNLRWLLAAVLLTTAPALLAQPPETGMGTGTLYLRRSPVEFAPAARLATNVEIEVTGIVARVAVSQRFRNDSTDWLEGVYVFPLPEDAAVDRLTIRIGERRIVGEIHERERAQKIYERARDRGQHASLVEQERPNLFTTSVANIAPGQEVVIEIGYLQTVAYDQGRFSLRFPLTLTPRYIPGVSLGRATGAGWSFDTSAVRDASRVTPPVFAPARPGAGSNESPGTSTQNAVALTAVIDAGVPVARIESLYHEMLAVRENGRYRLSLAAPSVPMDRDFVLEWQPTAASEPRAIAFTETVANRSYVLAMFLPPDEAALAQTQPREMLLVIDTSGSMGGPSIEQAKRALQFALGRLNAGDRFNVIEFNSATRALFPGPVAAEPRTLAAASRFVAGLNADGGTEMEPAIRLALLQPTAPGYLRQIVFATDGSVGNEAALFEAIRRELGEARLFTIGIGAAPNSHFMRKAAQYGRGTFTQIGKLDEVEPRMQALFEKLEHAALTGIEIEWPAVAEVFPERVPDLYAGEPVVVAARFDRPVAGTRATPVRLGLEAHGTIGRLRWDQHVDVEPAGAEGVATSWARRKIEALLDSRLEGAEEDAIREAVVDVGLAFNLVSPYTSLVAVDKTPERTRDAALRRTAVANLLPAGVDAGAIFGSFPQTATDARVHLLAGFLLLAAALLVRARLGRAPR